MIVVSCECRVSYPVLLTWYNANANANTMPELWAVLG